MKLSISPPSTSGTAETIAGMPRLADNTDMLPISRLERQIEESTHPFAAEGGVPYTPDANRDPFEALDDLMTVVEALCPTWPLREPFIDGLNWRL